MLNTEKRKDTSTIMADSISATSQKPLVVDLDGSLLRSDLLLESGMAFVRQKPLHCYQPLLWLFQGKAALKENLAKAVDLDVSVLPYEPKVIELIKQEKNKGRCIILATASHRVLAEQVAEHLALFDEVLATDKGHNLAADNKRDCLVARYGEFGFDYVGNSTDDLSIWAVAERAWLVNPLKSVVKQTRTYNNIVDVFNTRTDSWRTWLKAMRLHQWLKNFLIFVPLLTAHQLFDSSSLMTILTAFILFGLCASSVYLLNDLLDLADDRHHASKCKRPFASGELPILKGLLVFPVLLTTAFLAAALLLPLQFLGVMLIYYLLTLSYSLLLKRHMAVDVIALAILYTIRIVAGAAALALPLTFWILAFSMFMFLSLALVKRYAELHEAQSRGETEQTRGRGYFPEDTPIIASLGTAAGYISVMVLALYIHDQETVQLYTHANIIWLACPILLFWLTRVWILTYRGQMHDDPVVFAVKDRISWMTGALFLLIFWAAA